jgi:hypothetical protein
VLPTFIDAFSSFVRFNFSKEVMRYMAVFITFALHNPAVSSTRSVRSQSTSSRASGSIRGKTPTPMRRPQLETIMAGGGGGGARPSSRGGASVGGVQMLSRRQLAIALLELYSDLLCKGDEKSVVLLFAQTVTNRVSCRRWVAGFRERGC